MHSALRCVCAVLTLLVFCVSSMAEELDLLSNPSRLTPLLAASTVPYVKTDKTSEEKNVQSFRIPNLVEVNGVLIAIAEAHYDKPDDVASTDIVSTYSVDNGKTWETEVIIKNSGVSHVSRVVEPTVVVKGNKIYILVGSFNKSNTFWASHHDDSDSDPLIVVGEVTTSTSGEEGAKTASITWAKPVSLKDEFDKQKQPLWILFVGGTRTGLLMNNGIIVFPLQVVRSGAILPTIMYSNDSGSTWTFSKGSPLIDRSSEPSLVEWEGKLIMSCRREDGMRRFYESSDMGNTWAESYDKLSRVWGNAPDREGPGTPGSLIAVDIDGSALKVKTNSAPVPVPAVCAEISCESGSVKVKYVGDPNTWHKCPEGQTLTPSSISDSFVNGTIKCPKYKEVCTVAPDGSSLVPKVAYVSMDLSGGSAVPFGLIPSVAFLVLSFTGYLIA